MIQNLYSVLFLYISYSTLLHYIYVYIYLVDHFDVRLQETEVHSPASSNKCNLLLSPDDIYHDIVLSDNCDSIKSESLKPDQYPSSVTNFDLQFYNSNSDLVDHQLHSPTASNPISQDFISYNITPVNSFTNDSEITIHTLNFNSTYSDVSPRHSHHFSDGLLVPKSASKVFNVTSDNRYHLRGNSVTQNVTVC